MSNIYLYEDITCGVAGFLASANEMLQHPHTAGREIMTICGELTSSNDGRDVEIYCAEYSQGRGEAGNMYTWIFHLLFYSDQLARMCNT